MLVLTLLALASPIAVQVEEVGELERDQALELARSMGQAIETRTASTAQVEDPAWWGCTERIERCLEDVRARSGAGEVVMLRLFGSVRAIRVAARRFRPGHGAAFEEATIDLVRSSSTARGDLDRVVLSLYPEARRAPALEHPTALAPASRFGPLPWILVGVGVAALGAGAGFAVSSQDAKSQLESATQSHVAFEDLSGRMDTHGVVAGGLFVGAGVAVIAAVALWMLDDGVDVPAERIDRAPD